MGVVTRNLCYREAKIVGRQRNLLVMVRTSFLLFPLILTTAGRDQSQVQDLRTDHQALPAEKHSSNNQIDTERKKKTNGIRRKWKGNKTTGKEIKNIKKISNIINEGENKWEARGKREEGKRKKNYPRNKRKSMKKESKKK